jgi:hypothetical protein
VAVLDEPVQTSTSGDQPLLAEELALAPVMCAALEDTAISGSRFRQDEARGVRRKGRITYAKSVRSGYRELGAIGRRHDSAAEGEKTSVGV